ncbi:hypothetical protein [Pandoraea sputorum]|uniref:hypothetical protein n=1 Tax=Pandoraea sputorum TaxID=93222 RepID=UPI001241127D|nr:hypothetical protein [Pandoraea sputorum]
MRSPTARHSRRAQRRELSIAQLPRHLKRARVGGHQVDATEQQRRHDALGDTLENRDPARLVRERRSFAVSAKSVGLRPIAG